MHSEVFSQSICVVLRAANLYYFEGKSQKEISSILNISVPTVSRLLRRAKEEGIISFVMPTAYQECLRLERVICEEYDLKEVFVVPPESGSEEGDLITKRAVALEGARYVQRMLQPKDILGIAWGGTMYELIQYLNPCRKAQTTFVTLHGSIYSCNNKLDVGSLVRRIAMAFGGKHYALRHAGLQADNSHIQALQQQPEIAHIFSLFQNISFSVSGIGSFYPEATSPLSQLSYLTEEEFSALCERKPYGDLMLRFIDENGDECNSELAGRTLAIDMETYRRIPRKLIVASGIHKAYTVRSALRGGLADVLILDYGLAKKLVHLTFG